MEKSKIILASGSPRRKELLLQIGIVPEIIVSHVEEKITSDVPAEVVMSLAEQKAVDVAKEMPEGTVILGSDTVVAADGKILGKPKSHEEAYEMIRRLAGRSHQVYTGVCLVKKGPEGEADTVVSFYDETDVNVSPMTEKEIREYAERLYPIDFTLDEIRPDYDFVETCQGSVPQALESFFESTGFEDAIRNAVSIGGDSDTIADMAGAIAEAYYGADPEMKNIALSYLDQDLLDIAEEFERRIILKA